MVQIRLEVSAMVFRPFTGLRKIGRIKQRGNFSLWNCYYYQTIIQKRNFCVDSEKVSPVTNESNDGRIDRLEGKVHFHQPDLWNSNLLAEAKRDCLLLKNLITENEENILLAQVESPLKRLRYEESHWDDAIYLYRETEKTRWSTDAKNILDRVKRRGFPAESRHLAYIHILDLHRDGHIKPHIDAVRYCGDTIVGLSLLSPSVMRLIHTEEKNCVIDLLLERRSAYILRGVLRYEFTHEILGNEQSYFNGEHIPRDRRISVMCRNLPQSDQQAEVDKGLTWNTIPE